MMANAARDPLLLVKDDDVFAPVLARALTRRGFIVDWAQDAASALAHAEQLHPPYAVIDLKLGEDSGLDLISALRDAVPGVRMLLLTGYASIATAVEAMRRGAHDYLTKPVEPDAIVRALRGDARPVSIPDTTLPLPRLE